MCGEITEAVTNAHQKFWGHCFLEESIDEKSLQQKVTLTNLGKLSQCHDSTLLSLNLLFSKAKAKIAQEKLL